MGYEFMTAVTKNMPGGGGGAAPQLAVFSMWGAVLTVLGLAFPIALLIALRSRTVRDFFNSVAPG
jgi:hypothetical protein